MTLRRRTAALTATLIGVCASAPSAAAEVAAPAKAIVLVMAPPGAAPGVRSSDLVRLAIERLAAETDLVGLSPEQAGVDLEQLAACPLRERFRCLVERAPAEGAAWLFLFAVEPTVGGRVRVSALALELVQARELLARAGPSPTGEVSDRLEDELFASSVQADARETDRDDDDALERVVEEAFAAFRPRLAAEGRWSPRAKLTLELPCPGCAVYLDGRLVTTASGAHTELGRLAPGRHELRLLDGEHLAWSCALELAAGAALRVRPDACRRGGPAVDVRSPGSSAALLVAGAASVLGGAALVIYAADRAASGPATVCLGTPASVGAECAPLGSPSFGLDPTATPSTMVGAVSPSGLAPLPLGLAFLGAGATWGVAALVDDELPAWLVLVGGTVLGAGIYGLTAALAP